MVQAERLEELDSEMGLAFRLQEVVRLDQLDWEIAQGMGWSSAGLSMEGDIAQGDQEAILWVGGGHQVVSIPVITTALSNHTPDPEWFPTVATPPSITLSSVIAKSQAGGVLTPEEVQFALRELLSRVEA